MKDFDLENIVDFDFSKKEHKLRKNNIYLTDNQVEILNKYNIDYNNYSDIKSLLFEIENILNEDYGADYEDLSIIADEIAEFAYYNFTNK